MLNFDDLKNEIEMLHADQFLTEKEIDLSKYPEVEKLTCGGLIPIDELYQESELTSIYYRFKPYLDNPDISNESLILPVIGSLGNVYICLGFGVKNRGFVYYLDFDFGCFLLDTELSSFLSKLVDA